MPIHSYKELIVWQKAMDLSVSIYELARMLPSEEKYGLISQMRRAAVSIPTNIAEGRYRSTKKDYMHFLRISYGSGAELETLMELVRRLKIVNEESCKKSSGLLNEVMKMLNKLINVLHEGKT